MRNQDNSSRRRQGNQWQAKESFQIRKLQTFYGNLLSSGIQTRKLTAFCSNADLGKKINCLKGDFWIKTSISTRWNHIFLLMLQVKTMWHPLTRIRRDILTSILTTLCNGFNARENEDSKSLGDMISFIWFCQCHKTHWWKSDIVYLNTLKFVSIEMSSYHQANDKKYYFSQYWSCNSRQ